MKREISSGYLSIAALCVVGGTASVQAQSDVDASLHGLVNARLSFADSERSIFDGGFGKLRYGGDGENGNERFRIAEIALVGRLKFGDGFTVHGHIQHNPDQSSEVDIVEAYLRYKPVQLRQWQYSVRAGAFFPPVSFENEGLAWGNKYTITNSAANTWIAEEIRPIGAEFTAEYKGETLNAEIQATIFGGNDRAGDALGFRGFTLNDSKIGLLGDLPIADIEGVRSDRVNRPFVETDARPGFALGVNLTRPGLGELRLYGYDNRANSRQVGSEGRLWEARFINITAKPELPDDWTIIGQFQFGETKVQPTEDESSFFGTNFTTGSLLVAKEFGRVQLASRIEFFDQNDPSTIATTPPLAEDGWALTTAIKYRASKHHIVSAEYLYTSSDRAGGFENTPISQRENLLQINYQFRF
ncbi:outer membrane beta-barrel protein [Kordiimonas sp. SCSIO 12603]|uniref:outer membrane beta-barrel protein n=1 Tax=Kordiimonas sp. SCSIO 12603 TaxID=2829596 RepID=UPI00210246C9|nr:porin [Kordiimonas sp. SCSIO 12603]UTW57816.1 outer membrane beta-barrel protein [Kordiimonas sp. SCSIO 12603]